MQRPSATCRLPFPSGCSLGPSWGATSPPSPQVRAGCRPLQALLPGCLQALYWVAAGALGPQLTWMHTYPHTNPSLPMRAVYVAIATIFVTWLFVLLFINESAPRCCMQKAFALPKHCSPSNSSGGGACGAAAAVAASKAREAASGGGGEDGDDLRAPLLAAGDGHAAAPARAEVEGLHHACGHSHGGSHHHHSHHHHAHTTEALMLDIDPVPMVVPHAHEHGVVEAVLESTSSSDSEPEADEEGQQQQQAGRGVESRGGSKATAAAASNAGGAHAGASKEAAGSAGGAGGGAGKAKSRWASSKSLEELLRGWNIIRSSPWYRKLAVVWVIVAMTWEGAQVGAAGATSHKAYAESHCPARLAMVDGSCLWARMVAHISGR